MPLPILSDTNPLSFFSFKEIEYVDDDSDISTFNGVSARGSLPRQLALVPEVVAVRRLEASIAPRGDRLAAVAEVAELTMPSEGSDGASAAEHLRSIFAIVLYKGQTFLFMEPVLARASQLLALSLHPYIKNATIPKLRDDQIRALVVPAVRVLSFLHGRGCPHGQLRAASLALLADGRVVVESGAERTDTSDGAPYWLAPEVIETSAGENTADMLCRADIWALGITVIELLDGVPPHARLNPVRAVFQIASKKERPAPTADGVSERARAFVAALLERDPEQRPDIAAVAEHEWLTKGGSTGPWILQPVARAVTKVFKAHGREEALGLKVRSPRDGEAGGATTAAAEPTVPTVRGDEDIPSLESFVKAETWRPDWLTVDLLPEELALSTEELQQRLTEVEEEAAREDREVQARVAAQVSALKAVMAERA
jgi:hypothetical protein